MNIPDTKAADYGGKVPETQKPSVGRIVHYQAYGPPGGEYKSVPRAAIITAVYDAASVIDLCAITPTGFFFNQKCLYDADGKGGTWRWPPRV